MRVAQALTETFSQPSSLDQVRSSVPKFLINKTSVECASFSPGTFAPPHTCTSGTLSLLPFPNDSNTPTSHPLFTPIERVYIGDCDEFSRKVATGLDWSLPLEGKTSPESLRPLDVSSQNLHPQSDGNARGFLVLPRVDLDVTFRAKWFLGEPASSSDRAVLVDKKTRSILSTHRIGNARPPVPSPPPFLPHQQ